MNSISVSAPGEIEGLSMLKIDYHYITSYICVEIGHFGCGDRDSCYFLYRNRQKSKTFRRNGEATHFSMHGGYRNHMITTCDLYSIYRSACVLNLQCACIEYRRHQASYMSPSRSSFYYFIVTGKGGGCF